MARVVEYSSSTFEIDREEDGSDPVIMFGQEYPVEIDDLVDVLNFLVSGGYLKMSLVGCEECEAVTPDAQQPWPASN